MVVHVVRDADSNDPGVTAGVSPTDNDADFFDFFSRYFFDRTLILAISWGSRGDTLTFVNIPVR